MAKAQPAAPSTPESVRSNLSLTPELVARLERVRAAFAAHYRATLSLPDVQRSAMECGLAVLEDRLGIGPPAGVQASDTALPAERRARGGRAKS